MNNARGWHLIGFRSNHAEHLAKNLKAQVGLLYEANRIQYFSVVGTFIVYYIFLVLKNFG